MANHPTTGLGRLERYLNREVLTPETIKTALKETAFFMLMDEKSKKKGGYQFEVSVRKIRSSDTAKTFLPWDDTTDYVGNNAPTTAYPTQTYTRKDPTRNMEVKMAFAHDNIRLDKFEIDALETGEEFVNYFDELSEEMSDNFMQFLANQMLRGAGDGREGSTNGTASDMYGLYKQVLPSNMSANTNLDESTLGNNTHFGLGRHLFPHLVGRVFDANHVETVAAPQKITISNCTLTNGFTHIGFSSTDLTGAAIGWMVKITDASNNVTAGYEYRVGFLTAAPGQTKLQMTQIWRGSTASTYTVELVPFFRDDKEGDAGEWHIRKVYKTMASMVDGGKPNLAAVNSGGFYELQAHVEEHRRHITAVDTDLEDKGYENFKLSTCVVTIDEHEDSGRLSFYNTKYACMYWHKRYGKPKISKGSLRLDPTGRGINKLIGDMIMVGQPVVLSPKNCGALINLPTY